MLYKINSGLLTLISKFVHKENRIIECEKIFAQTRALANSYIKQTRCAFDVTYKP